MSDVKSKAIGFLYTLATNSSVRENWPETPNWSEFFDVSVAADDEVITTLNQIGPVASGQVKINQAQLEGDWRIVVDSMESEIVENLSSNEPKNIKGFDANINDYSQKLAVAIAEFVYNSEIRTQFKEDPASYLLKHFGKPKTNEQRSLHEHLVKFSCLLQAGKKSEAKHFFKETLADSMAIAFINEQSNIW